MRSTYRFSPKHKFPVIGQVTDVDGVEWGVRQVRSTKYGFDLLFGNRFSPFGGNVTGMPRLIATEALRDFWEAHRAKSYTVVYDLPAGRSTLKRVRSRLGFHNRKDVARFWKSHVDELKTMNFRHVAAKYDVSNSVVNEARLRYVGRRARPAGWWLEPGPLALLQSALTLSNVGKQLGISTSQVHRLRLRALQFQQSTEQAQNETSLTRLSLITSVAKTFSSKPDSLAA